MWSVMDTVTGERLAQGDEDFCRQELVRLQHEFPGRDLALIYTALATADAPRRKIA